MRAKLEHMAKYQNNARAKQLLAEMDAKEEKPQAPVVPEAVQEEVEPTTEDNSEESHETDS